jgi:molybdate transport system substrate-binding protein
MVSRRALILAFAAFAALAPATARAADIIVFAAASLKNALDDVTTRYLNQTGKSVTVSYAGTSTLAHQIEQGAPADIFFSADEAWMDYVAARNLIRPDTRRTLLGNRIVLVVPKGSPATIAIGPGMDLAGFLGPDGHLAMANTDAVPAGKYGKATLQSLGVWDAVAPHVVQADSVRAALAFVARAEAAAGIVYATDAVAEPGVRVVGPFPDTTHPPIRYPLAITAASTNPDAQAFFAFMQSTAARPAYEKQGFTVLTPTM